MKKTGKILSANLFPVVGVGASAGGLDAFKKLLEAIPEDSGMAFVLVQHLAPTHESLLPELLQKVTRIPVLEISDDIKVEPNHIYILPSNKMLVANDGVLQLSPRTTKKGELNLPIDLFFTSLAEVHQSEAIGVVLSGTGSDGTKGLKAIKDNGGITLAEAEASAAYDGMPKSAVQAGVVDFSLLPEEIPTKLLDMVGIINRNIGDILTPPEQADDVLRQMLLLLRLRKGTDFTYYKQTTVRRRILRRMAIQKIEQQVDYLTYLRENKAEQDMLYQDLLIPVTAFFRDPKTFATLCETVFPLILKNKTPGEPIRVWVAGCSTGEEAYSMAMCFREFLGENGERIQLFASDLSEPAIMKARSGVYTKTDVEGVSPQRLQEFFTKVNGNFLVNKAVRDMCVFAHHNFLKDPPFSKIDLVSCRNVLIYMEPYLQKKALTTFHYALNPRGFLLLGKSETISGVPNLFASVAKNEKLYTRKDVPGRFMLLAGGQGEQPATATPATSKPELMRTDFQKTADDIILSKYTPVGVVVNEAQDIVHFRGSTSNFLEQVSGKPTHNLLLMAKHGLAFELRSILYKAKKGKATVLKENIPVQINGSLRTISIEAIPLPNLVDPHYLVLFHETNETANGPLAVGSGKAKTGSAKKDDKDLRINQLEQELAQTREDMRGITEDQEAVNEELQSANEELLSSSEELQSLNEELETSKEELQSTNEELTVVNHEMIGLNEQVTIARDYAEAIIGNIREPLLVMDKNLRIKTANSTFYKAFHVTELETEGVLIYDLGNKQWNIPELRLLLEKILPEKKAFNDFELTHTFSTIGKRVMLLNAREIFTKKSPEELILLSIEDITEVANAREKERLAEKRFQNLVLQASVGIAIFKGPEFVVELANNFYLQLIDKAEHDFVGRRLFEAIPEAKALFEPIIRTVLETGTPYSVNEFEVVLNRFDKSEIGYFNFVYQPMDELDGSISGVVCVANEVTELVAARKQMEVQTTLFNDMLMTAPGFVATLSGPDHVYELVNEQYQRLFGKRATRGKPIMVALPELKGQGIDLLLDTVYNTGETYVGIDIPVRIAHNEDLEPELRYFNFSFQPMYDETKIIFSILVFGYEVTEQVKAKNKNLENQQLRAKELEENVRHRTLELREANELLESKNTALLHVNNQLESFNYISSHDLQEPLRKIQTIAGRILEKESENLTDNGKDYFGRLQGAAQRMQQLIQDLLDFSRVNTTEQKFENTDLNLITNEVLSELDEAIQEKHATVDVIGLGSANIIVFQFRQLMNNLIGNALKFAHADVPPHIVIKSGIEAGKESTNKNLLPDKTYCHISVSDNGIGFESQYSERIFGVFQRLHSRSQYMGTGIGLAIVKKIVENHHGFITATSEPGNGATFDIYIPSN